MSTWSQATGLWLWPARCSVARSGRSKLLPAWNSQNCSTWETGNENKKEEQKEREEEINRR